MLAHLDRVNVSLASLQMSPDIGLSPAAYGLGVGTFFIAYALFEVPSNVGLARFGARRWIARIMMTWGLVSASTAFVAGPTSFFANRILLGIAEAGFLPGVLVYLAAWLPAEHRGRAFATFLMAIPVANVLGGPLAGGLMSLDGFAGLRGWQWLFVLEGLAPVLLSVAIWRSLRDTPSDAEWLTPADVAALADGTGSATAQHRITARTIFRAIAKPRILLFTAVIACLGGINYALTFWLP